MQDTEIEQNKEHGFIKLWRSIREWEWFTKPETTILFLYLILSANWESKKWRSYTIKRGQFITSIEKLSSSTGLTVSQVRTSIDRLIKSKDILKQSTNRHTLITIVKYDTYQENEKGIDKQIANKSQTNDNQIATTKEEKEIKEEKERESTLAYDFLKLKCPKRLDPWERKYKPKIENFEKFIEDYNDVVVLEKIERHPDDLFKFLTRWAFGWIKNQPKYRCQSMN